METLPLEMVERIVRLLTPQDLARCSAVCRKWYEIWNQDWMWQPHCDPELEEPLRTTPCVVTPAFVAPEAGNSTLSPISCWKLAFMREQHLWRNWRRNNLTVHDMEFILQGRHIFRVEFLTDTAVVAWRNNVIEVKDISGMQSTRLPNTDRIDNEDFYERGWCVSGTNMVLAVKKYSIEVFSVDITNKSIKLKHNIHLGCPLYWSVVKENLYFYWNTERSQLIIIDVNTGQVVKEEPCPAVTQNEKVDCVRMTSSPTCDFVAVIFKVVNNDGNVYYKYYIYSPKELTFLPGPVAERPNNDSFRLFINFPHKYISLYGNWLALRDHKTLTVYNFQTREVVLNYDVNLEFETCECFNGFVFWGNGSNKSWVKYYCPIDRTLATIYETPGYKKFEVISNKLLGIYGSYCKVSECVLKLSGRTVEKWEISVHKRCTINRSSTRMLWEDIIHGKSDWNVIRLW